MSYQWALIAAFLYAEIAVVLLLVLPVASPRRWQKLFNSRFLQFIKAQAGIYFGILFGILVIFLLDAIREIRKYSDPEKTDTQHAHLDAEMQVSMRLFRAQRNFYIAGFALFLALVIRQLIVLISAQASLLAQAEANLRQAQSATTAARSLLAQKSSGESAQNDSNEAHDKEVTSLNSKINTLEKELEKEKKDKLAIKSQAESLNKEYDRLTGEYSQLQKKLTIGSSGDKKDE